MKYFYLFSLISAFCTYLGFFADVFLLVFGGLFFALMALFSFYVEINNEE